MGEKPANSQIARKYVSYIDRSDKNVDSWLEWKRNDDQTDGLWRVHDQLYDLTEFVSSHPGGKTWITMTKGTDITEAYETHHLNTDKTNAILSKFHVSAASGPRNIKLTFDKDGFFQTVKRKVWKHLQTADESKQSARQARTNLLTDALLVATFAFTILATYFPLAAIPAILSLSWLTGAGHNYIHQRDSFRMYYFNISLMRFDEWRVSHVLSHHLFPNSMVDMEMSIVEPFMNWFARAEGKNWANRFGSWVYGPLVYASFFVMDFVFRIARRVQRQKNGQVPLELNDLVPFSVPLAMFLFGGLGLFGSVKLWLLIVCGASFMFALAGLNAGHHHPEVFHDGDATREDLDWGVYQVDTMIDRIDLRDNHLLALTNFGDHILHHFFPTLDHGRLVAFGPILRETAEEFGLELRSKWWPQLIAGQHQQLARVQSSQRCVEQEKARAAAKSN